MTFSKTKVLGVFLGLAVAGVAAASAPTITMDPIGTLEYALFPQVYNVTGTVYHTPNVTSVTDLKLWINGVQEGATQNPNFGNVTSAPFSLPWNILGPGTYEVKVTARHGGNTGEDSEVVEVISSEIIIIDQCKAAPAIAADYLKNTLNWKPVSGKFKGVMDKVGKQTGVKGLLWAGRACEAGYRQEVITFVNGII